VAAAINAGEPVNPVDLLVAMADRESACLSVVEASQLDAPSPQVQFCMESDPHSGGWLGWTPSLEHFPSLEETHAHPRQPEITLAFASLPDDMPEHESVRSNRDAIIACFEQVL